jgi:hypothetical protein
LGLRRGLSLMTATLASVRRQGHGRMSRRDP